MGELSRVMEMFYIIIKVCVAWVYLFAKIVLLGFMYFPQLNLPEHLEMSVLVVAQDRKILLIL